MPTRLPISTLALLALAWALAPTAADAKEPPAYPDVKLEEAWPDVEFDKPIRLVNAGDGSDRLYVIEKDGVIKMLPKWRGVGAVPKPTVFLDLRADCVNNAQGGVFSLAFHPGFRSNRRAFVSYLAKHKDPKARDKRFKLVIAEVQVKGAKADRATLRAVFEIPKKYPIHQAGHIAFGPAGKLFISTGDGGSKNDKDGNAQNPKSLLGKMLRIDVDRKAGGKGYAIPADNPWPNMRVPGSTTQWQIRPEIYAFGMRNPWHFSFDRAGRLWTTEPGTTGAESREWVSEIRKRGNNGWPFFEGSRALQPLPPNAARSKFQKPTFEWVRGPGDHGTAGVGGHVYTGSRVPSMRGKYLFGDYMRGMVYCIDLVGRSGAVTGKAFRKVGDVPDLSGIGRDEQGEAYFLSFEAGMIFTLAPK